MSAWLKGKARRPREIHLRLWSRPSYNFQVDWITVCFKWSGHERREGSFNSSGRRINKPLETAYWYPRRCWVRASIFGAFPATQGGTAKLTLSARVFGNEGRSTRLGLAVVAQSQRGGTALPDYCM